MIINKSDEYFFFKKFNPWEEIAAQPSMFLLTQPAKLSIYPKNTQCWDRISSHPTLYINIHPENFYDKNLVSGPTYSMFSTYAYVIKQQKVKDEGAFVSFDGYLQSRSTNIHPVNTMMKIFNVWMYFSGGFVLV